MSFQWQLFLTSLLFGLFSISCSQNDRELKTEQIQIMPLEGRENENLEEWIKSQKLICHEFLVNEKYLDVIAFTDSIQKEIAARRKPETDSEKEAWGGVLVRRASAKNYIGDFIGAQKDYLEVLDIYRAINKVDFKVVKFVHHPLGNIYTRLGENEQAIRFLNVYIDSSRAVGATEDVGIGYSDLGTAHINKAEYATALEIYLKGLELVKGSDLARGLLTAGASLAYYHLDEFDQGVRYGQQSLIHFNRLKYDEYIAESHILLGKIYQKMGALDKCEQSLRSGEKYLSLLYPNHKHRKWGKLYQAKADLLVAQGEHKKALNQLQLAFASVIPNFDTSRVENIPDDEQLFPEVVISEALIKKANIYEELARLQPNWKSDYLKQALKHYEVYFQMEGIHRSEHIDELSKLALVQEVHDYGEDAIETALELYHHTKNTIWLEECVLFSERTKGIILSESNLIQTMKKQQEFPKQVQESLELRSKKESIESLMRKARLSEDQPQLKKLEKRLLEIVEKLAVLNADLKLKHPRLYDELFAANRLSREDIRSYSKKATNILTFYFGKKNIHCFLINKGSVKNVLVKINQKFTESLEQFMVQLSQPETSECSKYSTLASNLHNQLFRPFEKSFKGKDIVIIPDGPLTQLPFEALCKQSGNYFGELDYLVKDYSIRYAYSLKWLNQDFTDPQYSSNFLGVAPTFKNSPKYSSLSYSLDEISAGKKLNGQTISGKNATKEKFLTKANAHRILHLSTHAQMWDEDFQQASIAFYGEKNDYENHLLASELSSASIAPELMVLSACETGKGNYIRGEGMLSLSRIFAQSGTQNIMASLWKVNHESNSEILKGFYDTLRNDQTLSISEALSLSKRNYIKTNQYKDQRAHPYYWSGMVLMGNNELNLEYEKPHSWWLWVGGFVAVVLIALFVFRLLKKKKQIRVY